MKSVYNDILTLVNQGEQLLAVLVDPDKMKIEQVPEFIEKVNQSIATHIFVGGSIVEGDVTDVLVNGIKKLTHLPLILFPGDVNQITDKADALLFLSLISGRNAEYLIGKQVEAVSKLRKLDLEIIPTGYILIENGKETAVERVTETIPMSKLDIQKIVDTAKAGELLGMKLMYLEAGSGALNPIEAEILSKVKSDINIPIIVGGGIKNRQQLNDAYKAGADLVVIGTAFENDMSFLKELKSNNYTEFMSVLNKEE